MVTMKLNASGKQTRASSIFDIRAAKAYLDNRASNAVGPNLCCCHITHVVVAILATPDLDRSIASATTKHASTQESR